MLVYDRCVSDCSVGETGPGTLLSGRYRLQTVSWILMNTSIGRINGLLGL